MIISSEKNKSTTQSYNQYTWKMHKLKRKHQQTC